MEYEILGLAGGLQFGVTGPGLCSPSTRPTTFLPVALQPVAFPVLSGSYTFGCMPIQGGSLSVEVFIGDGYVCNPVCLYVRMS